MTHPSPSDAGGSGGAAPGLDGSRDDSPGTALTARDIPAYFIPRLKALGWAIGSTVLAAVSLVLAVLFLVSIPLVIVTVGIPMLFGTIISTRPLANLHRTVVGKLLDRDIASPYLAPAQGSMVARLRGLIIDRATWRDAAWIATNGTIGLALSIVGIVEAVLDLLFWWLPPATMMRVHAYLAVALLAPTEATTLAQRVQQLAETRADARDTSAAELRRIERDLHDGAQARLVALGMNLGMAEEAVARDPESARALITEARQASTEALKDLRDLVRGILPPVLADRGLIGAVSALALAAPIPIAIRGDLPERPAPPVESAAYFVTAEAVGNIIKHSGATSATVTIERRPGGLRVEVSDDGCGGADESRGTGLVGIRRRLAAFDGTLHVDSPAGGPTTLTMSIPT